MPESESTSIQFLLQRDAQQQEELTALRNKIEQLAVELHRIEMTMPRDQINVGKTPLIIQVLDLLKGRVSNHFVVSISSLFVLLTILNFVEVDRLQQAIDLYQQINSTPAKSMGSRYP